MQGVIEEVLMKYFTWLEVSFYLIIAITILPIANSKDYRLNPFKFFNTDDEKEIFAYLILIVILAAISKNFGEWGSLILHLLILTSFILIGFILKEIFNFAWEEIKKLTSIIVDYMSNLEKEYPPLTFCMVIPVMYVCFKVFGEIVSKPPISLMINNIRVNSIVALCLILGQVLIFKGLIQTLKDNNKLIFEDFKPIHLNKHLGIIVWLFNLLLTLYSQVLVLSFFQPEAFIKEGIKITSSFDLLYFTLVTFSTTGYGDISPNTFWGRFLTVNIIICGFLFVVIFISSALSIKTSRNK
ncbi:potassium channel family protein [Halanaerobacter jeridensis]|uniref:Potassium channel domain-containing protein n=1 Tax=Halanaerobacter jeridensis TaxID=706427 RepID=A0A939BSB2_9FIRM|nr:potassium channel family protein [Halanaerobacter jeridensis]MBM7558174.1 hypothetical protein [Halanaerobacter jeridensis]